MAELADAMVSHEALTSARAALTDDQRQALAALLAA
ncbi:unnamed protein product, partial [marine sediment metagenome]